MTATLFPIGAAASATTVTESGRHRQPLKDRTMMKKQYPFDEEEEDFSLSSDDGSTASMSTTSTVSSSASFHDSSPSSISMRKAKKAKKQRKSVSFCNHLLQYPNHSVFQEDLRHFWYKQRDYAAFRQEAVDTVRAERERAGRGIVAGGGASSSVADTAMRMLMDVVTSSSEEETSDYAPSLSSAEVIGNLYEACCSVQNEDEFDLLVEDLDSQPLQYNFEKLYNNNNNDNGVPLFLGLEKHVANGLREDKERRRKHITVQVSILQQLINRKQPPSQHGSSAWHDDVSEALCRTLQHLSRPSRLYAHCQAVAQFSGR